MIKYDKKTVTNGLIIATGAVLFYAILQNISPIANFITRIIQILMPFIIGSAIAFILNVPMRAIENKLLKKTKIKKGLRRGIALTLTFLALFGILGLVIAVIIPGISEAVMKIGEGLPSAIATLKQWFTDIEQSIPSLGELLSTLDLNWDSISASVTNSVKEIATNILGVGGNFIKTLVTSIGEFIISLAFSIYVLIQKENLSRQFRQIIYVAFPEEVNKRILDVVQMSNRIFSNFLSGQVLEACILGFMFFIAMSIFQMPYALLIGVLIAITALVPIIGAFVGCIVGALLIAITDPLVAIGFVALFLVLQQIEGNLIYPHVIGASVGLPSIWILVAVTLGGKLMGITGMLIFIPLCSVLYSIFRDFVYRELETRKISPSTYLNTPITKE